MDPLRPWLDADEVHRLAARLIEPARESAAPVTTGEVGFDQGFVGFTGEPPAPAAPQSARRPFLEEIHCFRDWMGREFSASGVFIVDSEGTAIFDDGLHERLHFLVRSLALASRRAGNVRVKIGALMLLEVIPVETAGGCLVLGALVPGSLPPESVCAVRQALAAIATPAG